MGSNRCVVHRYPCHVLDESYILSLLLHLYCIQCYITLSPIARKPVVYAYSALFAACSMVRINARLSHQNLNANGRSLQWWVVVSCSLNLLIFSDDTVQRQVCATIRRGCVLTWALDSLLTCRLDHVEVLSTSRTILQSIRDHAIEVLLVTLTRILCIVQAVSSGQLGSPHCIPRCRKGELPFRCGLLFSPHSEINREYGW
jgi:hypothetical protein